jgi:hypothetical protein
VVLNKVSPFSSPFLIPFSRPPNTQPHENPAMAAAREPGHGRRPAQPSAPPLPGTSGWFLHLLLEDYAVQVARHQHLRQWSPRVGRPLNASPAGVEVAVTCARNAMDVHRTTGCAQNVVVGSLLQGEDDHALEFTAPLWSWKTSCFFFTFLSEDPCLSLLLLINLVRIC